VQVELIRSEGESFSGGRSQKCSLAQQIKMDGFVRPSPSQGEHVTVGLQPVADIFAKNMRAALTMIKENESRMLQEINTCHRR
jgi:hypothetical protein